MKTLTATISNMSCASCAKNIERIVDKQEGVVKGIVNFGTEKLSVKFDERVIFFCFPWFL